MTTNDAHDIWPTGVLSEVDPAWWRDEAPVELGRSPFVLATELVGMQPALDLADRQALEALVVASLVASRQGSSRTPLSQPELTEIITTFADAPQQLAERAISLARSDAAPAIIGSSAQFKPLVIDGEWLYHQRLLLYEERLVDAIRGRLAAPFVSWPDTELRDALQELEDDAPQLPDGTRMLLSAEQRYALLTALHAPLSIITGGPGTGKTSIVVSLLRLFARLGLDPEDVALAAPTGKAAHRMGESIRNQLESLDGAAPSDLALFDLLPTPRTLHRLLEFSPTRGTFRRSADFPIDARLVVVDEASMIDLVLMERLAAAVPADSHLVLLGDAEQLPSVETGTVLRDLIPDVTATDTSWAALVDGLEERSSDEPTAKHAVRLTTSYRMRATESGGAAVLEVAQAVRSGSFDQTIESMADHADITGGVAFLDIEREELSTRRGLLREFLEEWIDRELGSMPHVDRFLRQPLVLDEGRFSESDDAAISQIFDHVQRARLLCLTRVWATGSIAVNALFHQRIARQQGWESNPPDFLAGDLVLMQRNDYERGLFNGDQGLILPVEISDEVQRMAIFPDGESFRAHHLPALSGQLDHAFAMTVHKAQGSEFDEVAVILPEEDVPLLTREILYTGITRCRHRAFVLGDETMLRKAIERPVARFTGIRDKLRT